MIPGHDGIAGFVFLISLLVPLLVFAIYPGLLWILARASRSRPAAREEPLPSVALITVLRNAESLVDAKVGNALALDYPREKLDVVVHSDGSTDGTEGRARAWSDRGVRVFATPDHRGKAHGLNAAVRECRADVLVFSDADALLEPDALRTLVCPLADPRVGGVCGRRVLAHDDGPLREAQDAYLGFDAWIKRLESRRGRITSNDGKLYAVRRDLFRPIDAGSTDDLHAALSVIAQGREFVYEPGARARIRLPSRDPGHEVERRRRIVSRSLRGIWLHRGLLNPVRFGWFSFGLFVNKVLRRILPVALLSLALATAWLALASLPHRYGLAILAAGALLAGADPWFRRWEFGGPLRKLSGRAYYATLGFYGTLLGVLDFLRGRTVERWNPKKGDGAALPAPHAPLASHDPNPASPPLRPPRVAYLMSRFPKLTETFVLYEILELERIGIPVVVYPLLRGRENVRHPDVDRLAASVRHQPLLSPAVLAANVARALRSPAVYVGTALSCVAGTLGSLRFLAGALAFFPKAVWFAQEMERAGITHIHAHFAHHPALAAYIVHRLTGIPFSFTAHGSDLHTDQRMLDRKIEASAFAATVSEYNREFIRERIGDRFADRMQIVRCGVDPDVFVPRVAESASDPFTVLCIAALRGVKGHRHLIAACRILKDRDFPFTCHLVGDGPLRDEIRQLVSNAGLDDRITLHGAMPRGEVLRLLGRASVLVLPSVMDSRGRREGIPVVLMEGMACGLPVVASRISGIPELVEDGVSGILIPPGDEAGIADALERLGKDPELRHRLGARGRERVVAEYHVRTNAARLAGLMCNHHGPSSPR